MKHTFYNVGHGDTIFIKPDDNEKRLIIRDMGCYSSVFSNKGMQAALNDLDQYIASDFVIDVIISHAHIDHYKGLKKLYDDGKRKIFRNTYIPYLTGSNRDNLLWSVFVISVGMYLYLPAYSYYSNYYAKAKNWLLLAPIMADLSVQVIGVSNASGGLNLGGANLDFLWPSEHCFCSLSSKQLCIFVRELFANEDFNDDGFQNFCNELHSQIAQCFKDDRVEDYTSEGLHTEYTLDILRTLEEKRKQVRKSSNAAFFIESLEKNNLFESYELCVDDHSIVFYISEEALYLSDLHENAMDEMFKQCGSRIASQYPLLKSAHHGTRICNDLKTKRFSKIIHCCGKGNRRYGRPLNDYKQMSSTVVYMDAVKAAKQSF